MVQCDRMALLAITLMVQDEGGPNNFTCHPVSLVEWPTHIQISTTIYNGKIPYHVLDFTFLSLHHDKAIRVQHSN